MICGLMLCYMFVFLDKLFYFMIEFDGLEM